MICRRLGWCLALLGALAGLAGCNTGMAEREAERRLRQRLPELIGPADSYRVNMRSSSDLAVMGGRLREITIEGKGVRIADEWLVDNLLVVLEKVDVDVKRQALRSVGGARFQVTLLPGTIQRYLDIDPGNLRDIRVRLNEGSLSVSGKYRMLSVWAPLLVSGTLTLQDKQRIGFESSRASAAGIPIPAGIRERLEKRLNPILDVSGTALPIDLTSVTIRPEGITVSGTPRLDDLSLFNGF